MNKFAKLFVPLHRRDKWEEIYYVTDRVHNSQECLTQGVEPYASDWYRKSPTASEDPGALGKRRVQKRWGCGVVSDGRSCKDIQVAWWWCVSYHIVWGQGSSFSWSTWSPFFPCFHYRTWPKGRLWQIINCRRIWVQDVKSLSIFSPRGDREGVSLTSSIIHLT